MKPAPSLLRALLLIVVLTAWVSGYFFMPGWVWLQPFVSGPAESLSGPLIVPAATQRPGRARLGQFDLTGRDSLLTLETRAVSEFSLQIKDDDTGEVARVVRFPPRSGAAKIRLALKGDSLPRRLRLTLWNRLRSDLEIQGAELQTLRPGYRWAPVLYSLFGPFLLLLVGLRNRQQLFCYLSGEDSLQRGIAWPRWDSLMAGLIFLLCFSIFRIAPVHQLLDSKFLSAVSHSFLSSGSVALPASFAPTKRARQIYTLRPVGEKTYHFFSSAPAVLNSPFVALFEMSGVSSVAPDGHFLGHHEKRILRFIAAFVAATLCAVLFLIARVWLPPGHALGLTLTFAFGTQIFSTVSRPFWSHSWSTLLLAVALLLLVSPRFAERAWVYMAIATLVCWAYFCRPPMSLAIVGVAGYVWAERRRFLLPFIATGMAWAGLFVLYSLQTYGSLVPPYFLSSHLKSGRLAGGLLVSSYPEAVLGTLISPGRGLFVYVPFLVLVLLVLALRWRWIADKRLAAVAVGVCVAHWQLVSMFRNWWGGQSFGPRLMSDLLPWFFLLAVLGMAALRAARGEGSFQWTLMRRIVLVLLVSASIFIHTRGATVQETQRGAGIWNWRYPQFMAGLLQRPEAPDESDDGAK